MWSCARQVEAGGRLAAHGAALCRAAAGGWACRPGRAGGRAAGAGRHGGAGAGAPATRPGRPCAGPSRCWHRPPCRQGRAQSTSPRRSWAAAAPGCGGRRLSSRTRRGTWACHRRPTSCPRAPPPRSAPPPGSAAPAGPSQGTAGDRCLAAGRRVAGAAGAQGVRRGGGGRPARSGCPGINREHKRAWEGAAEAGGVGEDRGAEQVAVGEAVECRGRPRDVY